MVVSFLELWEDVIVSVTLLVWFATWCCADIGAKGRHQCACLLLPGGGGGGGHQCLVRSPGHSVPLAPGSQTQLPVPGDGSEVYAPLLTAVHPQHVPPPHHAAGQHQPGGLWAAWPRQVPQVRRGGVSGVCAEAWWYAVHSSQTLALCPVTVCQLLCQLLVAVVDWSSE